MRLISKTTREKFEKFCAMRRQMGVSFVNANDFGSKAALTALFHRDPQFDTIPQEMFPRFYNVYRERHPEITLEEAIGVIKHSLIYQVVGATPEFIEEEA